MKRAFLGLAVAMIVAGCAQPSGPTLESPAPLPATGSSAAPEGPLAPTFPGKVAYVREGALWLAASGAKEKKLTSGSVSRPTWSPDGRALAYITTKPLGLGIWQSDAPLQEWSLDGALAGQAGVVEQLQWSPNSRHLAVVLRPEDAWFPREVWLLSEPGGLKKLDLPGLQENVPSNQLDITWRSDSRGLISALVDERSQVAQIIDVPLDGAPPAALLAEAVQAHTAGAYRMPNGSPDGKRLAFLHAHPSASISADGVKLMVLDLAAGKAVELGAMLPHRDWLAWSPDGSQLAFVSGTGRDAGAGKQVVIWNGEARAQVEGNSVLDPAWLSDGSALWVAYQSHPEVPRRIWKADPAGQLLSRCPEPEGNPALHDYKPMPTADGGLLFISVTENQPALYYADKRCQSIATTVVPQFDLPHPFYGHYPWEEVIAWHP